MPTPRSNELISQTSEPMMKSAPRVRHASDGRTHTMPPSLSRFPSRLTGRRTPRNAQLALIADASSPSVIIMATFIGSSVVTAANGRFRSAKVAGRCFRAKAVQRLAVQEPGPECLARQRCDFAPFDAGGKQRTDQTAGAGSSYEARVDSNFG